MHDQKNKGKQWFGISACMVLLAFAAAGCYSPCKDLVCTHGDCIHGECQCKSGYTGEFCTIGYNEKFHGNYLVTEIADSGNLQYGIEIAPTLGKVDQVSFIGLHRIPNLHVIGTIGDDALSFEIPATKVGTGTIESTGTCNSNLDGSTINILYRFTNDSTGAVDNCIASLIRQ